MKTFFVYFTLITLINVSLLAQGVEGTDLPYKIADPKLKPLRSRIDTVFQSLLTNKLKNNKEWKELIEEKRMCIGVVDIRDQENVKYARVNGNVMMYAASLPKIAILLAACLLYTSPSPRD